MPYIVKVAKVVRLGEHWFDEPTGQDVSRLDVAVYRQFAGPVPGASSFNTIIVDLDASPERLLAAMTPTTRKHVRRVEREERLSATYHDDPDDVTLARFLAAMDDAASQRGGSPPKRPWLEAYRGRGALLLSEARVGGGPTVWHACLVHGGRARQLYLASPHRTGSAEQRVEAGRINRWLHWADMVHVAQLGCTVYDLGGLFDDADPAGTGINAFKRGFGGREITGYNGVEARSPLGAVYLAARRALRR